MSFGVARAQGLKGKEDSDNKSKGQVGEGPVSRKKSEHIQGGK